MKQWKTRVPAVLFAAVLFFSQTALAAKSKEEDTVRTRLTYEEAVALATDNSSGLKSLADTVENLKDARAQAASALHMPLPSETRYSVLSSIIAIEGTVSSIKPNEEILQGVAQLTVLSNFLNIKTLQTDVLSLQKEYAFAQKELALQKVKHELGAMSKADYEKAALEIKDKKEAITQKQLLITKGYEALNRAVGLKPNSTYDLIYDGNYEPLAPDFELESYIEEKLATDPSIETLKRDIEAKENAIKYWSIPEGASDDNSLKEAENALEVSKRTYSNNVNGYEMNIRTQYNTLRTLESSIAIQKKTIESAETDLIAQKTILDVGKIVPLEYDRAVLSLEKARYQLLNTYNNHELLKFTFDNPYLIQ